MTLCSYAFSRTPTGLTRVVIAYLRPEAAPNIPPHARGGPGQRLAGREGYAATPRYSVAAPNILCGRTPQPHPIDTERFGLDRHLQRTFAT